MLKKTGDDLYSAVRRLVADLGGASKLSKETASIVQKAEWQYLEEKRIRKTRKERKVQVCAICIHRSDCWRDGAAVPTTTGCETRFKLDSSKTL